MAPHSTDGWYVGPSLNHYRYHKCFIPTISRCWDVLTLDWFLHTVPFRTVTADDYLKQTADNMLSLLQSKTTKASPLAFGSPITNAFIAAPPHLPHSVCCPPSPPTK